MAQKSPSAAPAPKPAPGFRAPVTFDLRQPLIVLRSHFVVAATLALVICTLVAWGQMRRPKQFSASATLVVERTERPEVREPGMIGSELVVATRLEQLHSPELLERVTDSLAAPERALVVAAYGRAGATNDSAGFTRSIVRSSISFERKPSTTLIAITAVHRDPHAAALLANRYAEQAIRYAFDRSNASNDASLAFLREQAEDMRKKSEGAERALQAYRQRFNLVSLEANQNIIVDNLKLLNASATAASVARLDVEAQLDQVEALLKRGGDPSQLSSIKGFEALGDIAKRIGDLRAKRSVLAERYGRRHPAMIEIERSLEALQKMRDGQLETAVAGLRAQRDKALADERQLGEQRSKAEKEALDLDQLGVEYNILRREVDSDKASYSQLLSRLNDAVISAQLHGVNIKISELATPPGGPFSPNPQKALLITLALAVAILLGYPFSAEMFFGRIRSASDVEYHLGCELLGEVGSVTRVLEKDRPFLVKSEHDEAAAEQFRALYSQLSLSSKIDPPKTILITSTAPGEGKSFIAANLAECFVAHKRKTLLIDADFRRPAQHRHFNIDNKAGILRWIESDGSVDGDLLKDKNLGITEIYPGFHLLRAGGISRRASELMEGGRLAPLLVALQRHFDITILDTPPAGIFPDAVAFARICHELIYICRFNSASRQAVRETLQRLRQTELDIPGVVLNAMPAGFAGSYYYKGYSYQQAKYYNKRYREPASS
jgi:polysaccharide biosynthesis transport protein